MQYQTTDDKTRKQRVTLIQPYTIKPLNNKDNKMIGITTYLSILTLNFNGLNFPIKRHPLENWIKKKIKQSVAAGDPSHQQKTSTD
jgi:hypothetical protein